MGVPSYFGLFRKRVFRHLKSGHVKIETMKSGHVQIGVLCFNFNGPGSGPACQNAEQNSNLDVFRFRFSNLDMSKFNLPEKPFAKSPFCDLMTR